jgi:hypothetical protein
MLSAITGTSVRHGRNAHQAQRSVQQMLDSPFYHPVIEEGLRTALRELQRAMTLPPVAPESCLECETPVA